MLSESQVQMFREQGFLNGGHLLDTAEVEAMREELGRVIEEREREDVEQPVLVRNLNPNPDTPKKPVQGASLSVRDPKNSHPKQEFGHEANL